jgi:hypothetical protein
MRIATSLITRLLATSIFVCAGGLSTAPSQTPQTPTEEVTSVPAIKSHAEFDSLAIVYDANTSYALPHVLFVIDRQQKNRIYYVNTKLYKFHKILSMGLTCLWSEASCFSKTIT